MGVAYRAFDARRHPLRPRRTHANVGRRIPRLGMLVVAVWGAKHLGPSLDLEDHVGLESDRARQIPAGRWQNNRRAPHCANGEPDAAGVEAGAVTRCTEVTHVAAVAQRHHGALRNSSGQQHRCQWERRWPHGRILGQTQISPVAAAVVVSSPRPKSPLPEHDSKNGSGVSKQ